jgi:hypothetical protein
MATKWLDPKVPRLSPTIEKPFRKALGQALRNEIDQMHEDLMRLSDEQIASCINLCTIVSGWIAVSVCGGRWPDEVDLRQLGEAPTESKNARAFGVKEEDAYAYIKRVALGGEPLNAVFPSLPEASTLAFVITGHLVVAFSKYEETWSAYLDKVEDAWERAQVADLDLLPGLMLRSRHPVPRAAPESPSGTEAASS